MAVQSVPSWAVAVRDVTQSSATTVGSCGTPTRRVTRPGVSEPATPQAATMPPRCTCSMKNLEGVRLAATVTYFFLSLFQTLCARNERISQVITFYTLLNQYRRTCGHPSHIHSVAEDAEEIKACPRCGAYIMKTNDGSCNRMNCTVCACQFCWLCMQEITDVHYLRYSHHTKCPHLTEWCNFI